MIGDTVKKLPKSVKLSPDIRERAEAYMVIRLGGYPYYVPITKEMKKVFKIKRKGKIYLFDSFWTEVRIRKFIRDIISAVYLQVRDHVCTGIEASLSQELTRKFEDVIEDALSKRVEHKVQKKLDDVIRKEK